MRSLLALAILLDASLAQLASNSCPCEACDNARSGIVYGASLPRTNRTVWLRKDITAQDCASDGVRIVCTLEGKGNSSVVTLDKKGHTLWTQPSGYFEGLFEKDAGTPVLATNPLGGGGVWVMGGDRIAGITESTGGIAWSAQVSDEVGGIASPAKFSPMLTNNNYLVVRLGDGFLAAYDAAQGNCWAAVGLGSTSPDSTFYQATGTVAILENRAYVPTEYSTAGAQRDHRLYAADVREEPVDRIKEAWHLPLHRMTGEIMAAKSTVQPVVMVFGYPQASSALSLIAVQDSGTNGTILWSQLIASSGLGCIADPRGGVWIWNSTHAASSLVLIDAATGAVTHQ